VSPSKKSLPEPTVTDRREVKGEGVSNGIRDERQGKKSNSSQTLLKLKTATTKRERNTNIAVW